MMKTCRQPFEYIYLDHFNGNVWLCPWMTREGGIVGNLFANSLEEIWHGEKARNVRARIAAGDLSLCRVVACPHLPNNSLPDLEGKELAELTTTAAIPLQFNLAFDFLCNQSCETCRKQIFKPWDDYEGKVQAIIKAVEPYLPHAQSISLAGHGEVFFSPYMMGLLERLRPVNPSLEIRLESNGVYLDEKHWKRIAHLMRHIAEINITVNSFDEYTYNLISRGGNYRNLIDNLIFVGNLRTSGDIRKFFLGMVLQDRNFRELPSFIRRARDEFHCDRVVIKPVYQWGTMPEDVFWFKDVLNPLHPYHQEYLEIMRDPVTREKYVYNFCGGEAHPASPFPGHSLPVEARA